MQPWRHLKPWPTARESFQVDPSEDEQRFAFQDCIVVLIPMLCLGVTLGVGSPERSSVVSGWRCCPAVQVVQLEVLVNRTSPSWLLLALLCSTLCLGHSFANVCSDKSWRAKLLYSAGVLSFRCDRPGIVAHWIERPSPAQAGLLRYISCMPSRSSGGKGKLKLLRRVQQGAYF